MGSSGIVVSIFWISCRAERVSPVSNLLMACSDCSLTFFFDISKITSLRASITFGFFGDNDNAWSYSFKASSYWPSA